MSFRQTYYTACEKGLSTGTGFQFNAASTEIEPATLQRIERLGSYAPPRSAPARPTTEELKHFPISLFFYTVNEAEVVLGQAKYIGQMADGRYGNFFAHTLVSNDPYSDFFKDEILIPIETWLSKNWVTTEHDSTVLQPVEAISFGDTISFERVQQFLKDPARREVLPRYLSAVIEALKSNRRIILIDDNENVALWIAAASYALSYQLVLRLTFSTYAQNPYDTDALITGTTEDSSFKFAPHELEHLFSVFDFKGGRFSPIESDGFSLKVSYLYQQQYSEVLTGFPVFVEQIAPNLGVEELEDSLSTYCYFENTFVPDVDDVDVLVWSSRHLPALAGKDFSNLFNTIVRKGVIGPEVLHATTSFYLAALDSAIETPSIRLVRDLYVRWLITDASSKLDPELLNETADRLPVHVNRGDVAQTIFKEWLRQLKDADHPARFAALLRLGDRIGCSEEENDILQWLGKNVAGAWLSHTALQKSIQEISTKSAGKCLLEGIAAFLVEHVDNRQLFSSFLTLIADSECYEVLSNYTVKTQNLPLYLRLSGLKANLDSAERVSALTSQLSAIQSSFHTGLTPEIVQTAFHSIWFDRAPTLSETCQLVAPPLFDYIIKSDIPVQLVASLNFNDDVFLPEQIELIDKLNSDAVYVAVDESGRAKITAYALASEFQRTVDHIGEAETISYLEWLTTNRRLLPPIAPRLFKFLGRKFARVKNVQIHAKALPNYLREAGFLDGYQSEVVELTRTRKTHQELAALVRIWTMAARQHRSVETYLRTWLSLILKNQSRKDIQKLEAGLDHDTFRIWAGMRKRIELEQKSSLVRFFDNILGRD